MTNYFAIIDTMPIIASDVSNDIATLLEGYDHPAILLNTQYQILATNTHYLQHFGEITPDRGRHCYEVSHGYNKPCDQSGESCPLSSCTQSGKRERVLHIHETPRGKEHVDVEMLPILDDNNCIKYFVEIIKPVNIARAEISTEHMVGRSSAFNTMVDLLNLVAPHDTSVLLLGESGTGKEMAAQAVHNASKRKHKPLITVECAGFTETLFESELFGHVKGAFTGAIQNKQGLLESAEGSTLFLDEIGDVPLGMQVKLLRLLETGTYRPVGSVQTKIANFRLVCATHKDLPALVESGEFRQDLYYRINAFPIHLPSLRERQQDIPLLAKSILQKVSSNSSHYLTDSAVKSLTQYNFPGNIRELRNILERAVIIAHSNIIDSNVIARCLILTKSSQTSCNTSDKAIPENWPSLKMHQTTYLQQLLNHCDGNKQQAADIAGISLRSFYRRLGHE